MVMHESLKDLQEVPLFLKPPTEQTRNYEEIIAEFGGTGYLNFNMIL